MPTINISKAVNVDADVRHDEDVWLADCKKWQKENLPAFAKQLPGATIEGNRHSIHYGLGTHQSATMRHVGHPSFKCYDPATAAGCACAPRTMKRLIHPDSLVPAQNLHQNGSMPGDTRQTAGRIAI